MVFACKHEAAGSVAEVAVERAFHRVPGPECWLLLRTPTELWAGLNGKYGGRAVPDLLSQGQKLPLSNKNYNMNSEQLNQHWPFSPRFNIPGSSP